jgi:zinc-binding alcohol dehydrogenase/oxidoreductase
VKALVLQSIKSPLEFEDRPDLTPSADEVVIRLKAAALNRRDYWITQGMYPGIETPVVLGSDGAGEVSMTGSRLGNFWQGREVIINPGLDWGDDPAAQGPDFSVLGMPRDGTFATEVIVNASQLHEKPSHLDWHQAAALPLAGLTAWRALFTQGQLQSGETVLITGIGGGVAAFALQFAVACGAHAWVTSSSQEKIDRAVEVGAMGGFDYTADQWSRELVKEAGSPHLIIDGAGGQGYRSLLNVAAAGGRIVNYGSTAGAPDSLELFKVFWKQLRLQGSTMGSPQDFAAMLKFVGDKQLVPIVDSVMPLADGNLALDQMQLSPQFGKFVLSIDS